jgi:hypothetical protein
MTAIFQTRSQNCEKCLLASLCQSVCLSIFCPSVRPSAWNNSAPTGRIFMKLNISVFFENLSRKFKFRYKLTRISCNLHEDQCTYLIKSRAFRLRMRNVSNKFVQKIKTHILLFNNFNRNSHLLRNNVAKYGIAGQAIWRLRVACWIPKATNTHTQNM